MLLSRVIDGFMAQTGDEIGNSSSSDFNLARAGMVVLIYQI